MFVYLLSGLDIKSFSGCYAYTHTSQVIYSISSCRFIYIHHLLYASEVNPIRWKSKKVCRININLVSTKENTLGRPLNQRTCSGK